MEIKLNGRKEKIVSFVSMLKDNSIVCSCTAPEAFKFSRGRDWTCMTIHIDANYLDFGLFSNKKFRSLAVNGRGRDFSFEKPNGVVQVTVTKQSTTVFNYVHTERVFPDSDDNELGDYDTLELYEERLRR